MYVVIAGGGRIGRYIAEDQVSSGNDVTVIERDASRCEALVANHPVLVIQGDAGDTRYLEQAHLDRADVFVATTHDDEENLVACQLARVEFGVRRTISRVSTPKNVAIFHALGIEAVSSTQLISQLLEKEFNVGDLVHLTSLRGGKVSLVEVRIPDIKGGPEARFVADLDLPHDCVLVAIFRQEAIIIPRGTTQLLPGDDVVALTTPELESRLRSLLHGTA